MYRDAMDDIEEDREIEREIEQLLGKDEASLRRAAESDPKADPSIYAPWGRMSYPPGYKKLKGKCDRPD